MAGRSMALDVLVRLRDMLSGPLRGLRNQLSRLVDFTRRIGVLGAAIAGISFMGPINEAGAFQQKLLDIASTAELSGNAAFAFVDEQAARFEALALKVGQHSDTIADGAGQMIAAGINRGLVDATIEDIGRATTAANANFADMASVGTSMLQNLKLPAGEMRDALGALVVAGKEGAFELKDMAATFPNLTSGVAKFGVKGREAVNFLAAALQIARKGTADPGQAANNLSNFLDKALSPLTKKNFKKHHVDIEAVMMDAATRGLNPIEAVIQKIGKLTGVSDAAIGKMMEKAKAKGLEGADALADVREQLEAIGAAGKIGELFQDKQVLDFLVPFLANIDEYKRIKEKVAAATGAAIDPDFETKMQGINEQLIVLGEIGTQAVRMVGFAFAEWLPTINDWLMSALAWVRGLDKSTGGLVTRTLSFAGAGLLVVSALGALGIALPIIGAGLSAIGALIGLVLSPLGIFVGLLAAGGAYVWKHWDKYGPRLTRLWERGKRVFADLASTVVDRGRRIIASGLELARRYGPVVGQAFADAWQRAQQATTNFLDGFRPAIAGVDEEWGKLVTTLGGTGDRLKSIAGDLFSIAGMAPDDAVDFGWLGRMFGKGLTSQLADLEKFGADLNTILDAVAGISGWLGKSKPDSWGNLFGTAVATTARDLLNPVSALTRYVKQLSDILGNAVPGRWDTLLPTTAVQTVKDLLNPVAALVDKIALLLKLFDELKKRASGTAAESAFPPADPSLVNPDRSAERDNWYRQFGTVPFEGGMHRAGRGAGPQPGSYSAPQPPVRLDGNVRVTIKVDGPGKVTGITSDNASIKVGGSATPTGRMTGTV